VVINQLFDNLPLCITNSCYPSHIDIDNLPTTQNLIIDIKNLPGSQFGWFLEITYLAGSKKARTSQRWFNLQTNVGLFSSHFLV
jgi:hypothetical protein